MGRHLLSVLTLLIAASAAAYPTPVDFDGSLMRWDIGIGSPPITYELKADDPAFQAEYGDIIDDAAAMWSDVPTSYFTFAPVTGGDAAQVTVHLKSAIEGGAYSAGYAIFDDYDGIKPKHCAIYVVVDDYVSYSGMQKTILHEFGHCLGLGHTLIPEAIMSYRLEENSFALDVDDRAAASRLYPADGSKPHLAPGCAIGATRGASSRPLALMLCVPLLLAAGLHARRRIRGNLERRAI